MFSIVIPVFNTPIDAFIRCINSIKDQTYKKYEVNIVDDGSAKSYSDQYVNIIRKYKNMRYYKKSNGGVSSARNFGIDRSQYNYILFIDADDTINECFLQEAHDYLAVQDVDLLIGSIDCFPNKIKQNEYISHDHMIDLKYALLNLPQNSITASINGSPCGKIYKTSLARKIKFKIGVTHWEDQIFNREYISLAEDALIVNNVWYYYHQNSYSAMHKALNNHYFEKSVNFWNIWNELNKNEQHDVQQYLYVKNIDYFYSAINQDVLNNKESIKKKISKINNLYNQQIFEDTIKNLDIKYIKSIKDKVRFFLMKRHLSVIAYIAIKIKNK